MGYIIFMLLLMMGYGLVARPVTVLCHELGHAIPVLLFTGQKTSIYVGSYGDQQRSFRVPAGLLDIWFTYNPLTWQRGLCVPPNKSLTVNQQILFTLGGAFVSLIIAVISWYFIFMRPVEGALALGLFILLGSSVVDLIGSLNPSNRRMRIASGQLLYNDGQALKRLFKYRKQVESASAGMNHYREKRYAEAAPLLQAALAGGYKDESVYRVAISSYVQVNDYTSARELVDEFVTGYTMNTNDHLNAAFTYSKLGLDEQAIGYYDKALALEPNNAVGLNNKAFILLNQERYAEALPLLDKAVEVNPAQQHFYTNRGLARIKTGMPNQGQADLQHAMQLGPDNGYTFRNMGIYHLDKGDHAEALRLLKRAKELDHTAHQIDELIASAERGG